MTFCRLAAVLALLAASLWGQSNPVPFINNPLVPTSVAPGGPEFSLTINGSGFVPGATVSWNNLPLSTSYISVSQLVATVPSTDIATAGAATVNVINPAPGGGISNGVPFEIALPIATLAFAEHDYPVGVAEAVAVADFNNDGKPDLATAVYEFGSTQILLGNGDGTFQAPISVDAPNFCVNIVAGDLNQDGNQDLVITCFDSGFTILLGNGDGTFQPPFGYGSGTVYGAQLGDLNGDGNLDVVAADQGTNAVCVFLGKGDGTLRPGIPAKVTGFLTVLALGDYNRDGRLDVAAISGSNLNLVLGNGDGTLAAPIIVGPTGGASYGMTTADLNRDGFLDVAVVAYGNPDIDQIAIFLGNGDGTFQPVANLPVNAGGPYSVVAADFNGDDLIDLASADYTHAEVSVFLGNGDGSFQPEKQWVVNQDRGLTNDTGIAFGDFNLDGRADLVTADNEFLVSVLLNTAASLSPLQVKFNTVTIGDKSPSQGVTFTNVGVSDINISGISISGTDATAFVEQSDCVGLIPVGASCLINVRFIPHAPNDLSASLLVTDDAVGSPQEVGLTGVGSELKITPSQGLDFGTINVGQTSQAMAVTLSDSGRIGISYIGATFDGPNKSDFQYNTNCHGVIGAQAACTIKVQFTPGGAGMRGARLGVTTRQESGDLVYQSIPLRGTGD